jgi:transcription antitermination factor NusG
MNSVPQDATRHWYVVYTRSRFEKKVAGYLAEAKIEHYCPLNKVVRQWSDRKKIVLEPLFPSYVFIRVAKSEHARIRQVKGIVKLVNWLGKPAIIRDQEIDIVKCFLNDHIDVKVSKIHVNVDDEIRVISGPLMEQQGRVVGIKNNSVKVTLPSLRYVMRAEISLSNIEVIHQSRNTTGLSSQHNI